MVIRRENERRSFWLSLQRPGGEALPSNVATRLDWYSRQGAYNRNRYRTSEVAIIALTATIPVTAALGLGPAVGAVLGAMAAVLVGLRQLYQWHAQWIRLTETLVRMQREVIEWCQGIETYACEDRTARLAQRIEELASGETMQWSRTERTTDAPRPRDQALPAPQRMAEAAG
jgi:hypothetical protein